MCNDNRPVYYDKRLMRYHTWFFSVPIHEIHVKFTSNTPDLCKFYWCLKALIMKQLLKFFNRELRILIPSIYLTTVSHEKFHYF